MVDAFFYWLLHRTKFLSRPGVGALMISVRRWAPKHVHSVEFRPEGSQNVYVLPEAIWQDALRVGSFEEMMALVRSVDAPKR